MKVKQRDISDCGAACLASVAQSYKLKLPVAKIRQHAGTDQKGTTVQGMIEAAKKLGFQAKGVKGKMESLPKIPKPAIAHVIVNKVLHHFVVIYKVKSKYIQIMDPADGRIHRKKLEEFEQEWTGVLILLMPDDDFKTGNFTKSTGIRFWKLISPYKSIVVQSIIGAIIVTVLGLSSSIFVQKITDNVLVDQNRNLLSLLGCVMVITLVIRTLISVVRTIFTIRTGQLIDARLILGYYKHIVYLPQQFFNTMRVGEVINRVNDATKIRAFINEVAVSLLINVFIVLFSFGLMFTFYWKLAAIVLLIIPAYGLIYYITDKFNKNFQRRIMEQSAELESQLVESITSMETIKRFGLEEYSNTKTERLYVRMIDTIYQSNKVFLSSNTASDFVSQMFTIILFWVGANYVLDHEITPGELFSFSALMNYFIGPAASLIGANRMIRDANIAADRLFEIMDLEIESSENKIKITDRSTLGDIRFENVTFGYNNRLILFENLNLLMERGKFTAIVGESGAGKSSMLSILQNIYPTQTGNIYIGKYNIKFIANESLRSIIGVVPQKVDLFSGNVLENIAIGDPEPNMDKVLEVCNLLGLTKFIEELPYQFFTPVGENGSSLSGGQRQRLALARALYRDPEILILDEATSSLDSISETFVHNAIQHYIALRKTIIIISHRLNSVVEADKIILVDGGKVVEEGTHTDLLRRNGKYALFWSQQHHSYENPLLTLQEAQAEEQETQSYSTTQGRDLQREAEESSAEVQQAEVIEEDQNDQIQVVEADREEHEASGEDQEVNFVMDEADQRTQEVEETQETHEKENEETLALHEEGDEGLSEEEAQGDGVKGSQQGQDKTEDNEKDDNDESEKT